MLTSALVGAVVAGGMVLTAGMAQADSTCGVGGPAGQYSDAYGNSGVQVCTVSGSPIQGTVTVAGNTSGSTPTGYAVADGASTNPGAAAGYIGADNEAGSNNAAGSPEIVGCTSGDYTPGSGNTTLGASTDPTTVGQPDACSAGLPSAP